MDTNDINETTLLQIFITDQLTAAGYRSIEHVYIDLARRHILYKATLTTTFLECMVRGFFSSEQLHIFEDILRLGHLECQVLPDRTIVIMLEGKPTQIREFESEQQHFVRDLISLLKSKTRMDLRYIQSAVRKI